LPETCEKINQLVAKWSNTELGFLVETNQETVFNYIKNREQEFSQDTPMELII
jgi:hypothetical protein